MGEVTLDQVEGGWSFVFQGVQKYCRGHDSDAKAAAYIALAHNLGNDGDPHEPDEDEITVIYEALTENEYPIRGDISILP